MASTMPANLDAPIRKALASGATVEQAVDKTGAKWAWVVQVRRKMIAEGKVTPKPWMVFLTSKKQVKKGTRYGIKGSDIAAAFKKGLSMSDVAREFGISRQRVFQVAVKAGLVTPGQTRKRKAAAKKVG